MKLQILTTLVLVSLSSAVVAGSTLPTAQIQSSAFMPQAKSQYRHLVYSEIEINLSDYQEYINTVEGIQYKDTIQELLDELADLEDFINDVINDDLITITVKPGKALDDLISWLKNHPGAHAGITITQPVFNPNDLTCCEAIAVYEAGNMSQERAMDICETADETAFSLKIWKCILDDTINNT